MSEKNVRKMLRLLQMEYGQTNELIRSLVRMATTVRGWTITLSLAILGFGFERMLWQAGILCIVVVFLFGLIDVYHSWLYGQVLARAQAIDKIFGLYYQTLARGEDDPKVAEDFEVELGAYEFGLTNRLPRFQLRRIKEARPFLIIGLVYGTLALAGLMATFLVTRLDP